MQDEELQAQIQALANGLERELMARYGSPLLTGEKLSEAMGYRSIHSLRKHISQSKCPVELFTIEGRRGKFALVKDIAIWLAKQRLKHQFKRKEEI